LRVYNCLNVLHELSLNLEQIRIEGMLLFKCITGTVIESKTDPYCGYVTV